MDDVLVRFVRFGSVMDQYRGRLIILYRGRELGRVNGLNGIYRLSTVHVFVRGVRYRENRRDVTRHILLVRVSASDSQLFVPPNSPLIRRRASLLLQVVFVRGYRVLLRRQFCFRAFTRDPVVVVVDRLYDQSFTSAPSRRYVVVWERANRAIACVLRRCFYPIVIVVANAAYGLRRIVTVVIAAVDKVATMRIHVVFEARATSTSPAFVACPGRFRFP